MGSKAYSYDRTSFFANLRAQGCAITAEQEALFDKAFKDQSPENDIFSMCADGFNSAIAFFQNLLKSFGVNVSLDGISKALDLGEKSGDLTGIDRYAHLVRNQLVNNGMDQTTADRICGNTMDGKPALDGNIHQIMMAQAGIIPKNAGGFPTDTNPTVTAPIGPVATNQTDGLTAKAPGA